MFPHLMFDVNGLSKFPANAPTAFSLQVFAINLGQEFVGGEDENLDLVILECGILSVSSDNSSDSNKSVANFSLGLHLSLLYPL